jgi:predicted nucleotidyltransferase
MVGLSLRFRDVDDLEDLTDTIASVLADEAVAFAYVFGSVARGDEGPGSDVDVAQRRGRP